LNYGSKGGKGEYYWGTGAFVGERVIATAAHNLYDVEAGRWADTVEVIPGADGTHRPFGAQTAKRMFVLTDYLKSGADADDFGWIVLPDRKLYNRAGYAFGYRVPSYAQIRDWNLNSCGYPEPERRGKRMYYDYETRSQRPALLDRTFRYWHDTEHGCSGGPLFVHLEGVSYLAGVCVGQTRDWNIGCRIDSDVFEITQDLNRKFP
jgi:V8-like Glu-specific endopeptidase